MNNTFTLISLEGVRFEISRRTLSDNCITFAEILSNEVEEASKNECQLQEKEEEVKLLIDVLEGERTDHFKFEELRTVAELGNKYQSRLLHLVVTSQIMYHLEQELYGSFVLAFVMEDQVLGGFIAKSRIERKCSQTGGAGEWDQRFDIFRRAHLTALRNCLLDRSYGSIFYDGPTDNLPECVINAVGRAAYEATPGGSPSKLLQKFSKPVIPRRDPLVSEEKIQKMSRLMEEAYKNEISKIQF